MSNVPGIRDKKGLDDFVARMSAGRSKAAASRASSTAPPKPVAAKSKSTEIPQKVKAAGNASPVAKMPTPAKSKGAKPGSQGKSVTIHIHNH